MSTPPYRKQLKNHLLMHAGASYVKDDDVRIAVEFVCDEMDKLEERIAKIEAFLVL